jgi:hypothetical protein
MSLWRHRNRQDLATVLCSLLIGVFVVCLVVIAALHGRRLPLAQAEEPSAPPAADREPCDVLHDWNLFLTGAVFTQTAIRCAMDGHLLLTDVDLRVLKRAFVHRDKRWVCDDIATLVATSSRKE